MNKKDVKGILHGKVSGFAEEVAPFYKLLNWRWGVSDTPPTQAEIEQTLGVLIDTLNGEGSCATGGLEVHHDKESGEIGISFAYTDSTFY